MEEKHYFHPGNTVEVYRVDIGNIGMMICYDNWFSEQARSLGYLKKDLTRSLENFRHYDMEVEEDKND